MPAAEPEGQIGELPAVIPAVEAAEAAPEMEAPAEALLEAEAAVQQVGTPELVEPEGLPVEPGAVEREGEPLAEAPAEAAAEAPAEAREAATEEGEEIPASLDEIFALKPEAFDVELTEGESDEEEEEEGTGGAKKKKKKKKKKFVEMEYDPDKDAMIVKRVHKRGGTGWGEDW
jgi:hypothetical protein